MPDLLLSCSQIVTASHANTSSAEDQTLILRYFQKQFDRISSEVDTIFVWLYFLKLEQILHNNSDYLLNCSSEELKSITIIIVNEQTCLHCLGYIPDSKIDACRPMLNPFRTIQGLKQDVNPVLLTGEHLQKAKENIKKGIIYGDQEFSTLNTPAVHQQLQHNLAIANYSNSYSLPTPTISTLDRIVEASPIEDNVLISAIDTLAHYFSVSYEVMMETIDEAGLTTEDALSLALDLIPVVGSLKSLLQVFWGADVLTSEDVNRYFEFACILPYLKLIKKYDKLLTLIITLKKVVTKRADRISTPPRPNTPTSPSQTTPVKPGDTGTYKELKNRKQEFGETEPLHIDHQPSFAAQKRALEKSLNRKLTPEETAKLKENTPAVASPREVHQQTSPTYGGRNSRAQIEADSDNLEQASARDKAAFDKAMAERDRNLDPPQQK